MVLKTSVVSHISTGMCIYLFGILMSAVATPVLDNCICPIAITNILTNSFCLPILQYFHISLYKIRHINY